MVKISFAPNYQLMRKKIMRKLGVAKFDIWCAVDFPRYLNPFHLV